MKLIETIKNNVESTLCEGIKECNLDGAWYSLIKDTLGKMGYKLSSSDEVFDDYMDTNGWECDYCQYIFKDNDYIGYYLAGSLYFGQHEIIKDETNWK